MGGFTIDGCGVGDSFYPKLVLGNHYCKYCHSIQEFDLMEVKRKIKVLYIPTVSINTKYAVTCKKCKRGYYIEDNVRDDLLYGRSTIEVQQDKILLKKVTANPSDVEQNSQPKSEPNNQTKIEQNNQSKSEPSNPPKKEPNKPAVVINNNSPKFCSCCGAKLIEGNLFCTSCGVKIKK